MAVGDDDDDDWGRAVKQAPDPEKRLAELQAKAPVKRQKVRQFARVYLNPASRAFAAVSCQKAMVWVWLVYRAWKRKSQTVTVPNKRDDQTWRQSRGQTPGLAATGSGRADLDRPRSRKTPTVTLP